MVDAAKPEWKPTACILCTLNCGLVVQLNEDGSNIARVKGDKAHPVSKGYVCNKSTRIPYYISGRDRLLSPMKRGADGTYEAVSWDVAIAEIAEKLSAIRDTHGGDKIFYYGGGGQGNHLPGTYSQVSTNALGVAYRSNALAQEKTGEFWIADRMFGGWPHGDFDNAEVVIMLGKNPWQSHGIQRARALMREVSKDPGKTLIIIDPKRTETADLADIHLAVKPGRDAWLLSGLLGTLVQEDLINHAWLAEHADGLDETLAVFAGTDIADCAEKSGVSEADIRSTARVIAAADSAALLEDLGIQMNRHSTLVSYLQRLVWLLTGNFGRPGTHYTMNGLVRFGAGPETGKSPVVGARIINNMVPCNVIPEEILTDHPNRYRAMIIESGNPVHSLADSPKWREAMAALEFSVVIDVAMTETAREADYVLPATNQFEKAEATFFAFEFPDNFFHLRQPVLKAPDGPLDEAEIHMRLGEALGVVPTGLEDELRAVLAKEGREGFRNQVFAKLAEDPALAQIAPGLLYRTLGASLPDGLQNAAVLWVLCQQFAMGSPEAVKAAGVEGEGPALGDGLFDQLISSPSGSIVSREPWRAVWDRVPGGKVKLGLSDMLEAAAGLAKENPAETSEAFPFLLSAGERRAYTANTIIRDPNWRKQDREGALHIHPEDALRLNLGEGSTARISTAAGTADITVSISDRMQPGYVSLPNGMGLDYPDEEGERHSTGVSPNELTSLHLRDEFVGTPWHKSVPARIEAVD